MPGDFTPPIAPTVWWPFTCFTLPCRFSIEATAPARKELSCTSNISLVTFVPLMMLSTITKRTFGYFGAICCSAVPQP
jgi:ABC-type multidrug transport system permease subunit